MNRGRVVLCAFGLFGLLLIAAPVATVWLAARPGAPDEGIDGEISRMFLETRKAPASPAIRQVADQVAGVDRILPKGMPERQVFEKFATSGFICATDANAATCFRSHERASCREDWKVRVIFSDDGTVWSDKAERSATCL